VVFATVFQLAGPSYVQTILMARSRTVPGWFLLPIPNIHPDGKVCMGNQFAAPTGTMETVHFHCLNWFGASPFNTDLSPNIEAMQAMFRYDASGNQLPPTQKWETLCTKTNNEYMVAI
jgi:hypothetical protein